MYNYIICAKKLGQKIIEKHEVQVFVTFLKVGGGSITTLNSIFGCGANKKS